MTSYLLTCRILACVDYDFGGHDGTRFVKRNYIDIDFEGQETVSIPVAVAREQYNITFLFI
jgi:hypothetical protein